MSTSSRAPPPASLALGSTTKRRARCSSSRDSLTKGCFHIITSLSVVFWRRRREDNNKGCCIIKVNSISALFWFECLLLLLLTFFVLGKSLGRLYLGDERTKIPFYFGSLLACWMVMGASKNFKLEWNSGRQRSNFQFPRFRRRCWSSRRVSTLGWFIFQKFLAHHL